MNFSSWLFQPEPEWKQKAEHCGEDVIKEAGLENKEELLRILETLEKHNIL